VRPLRRRAARMARPARVRMRSRKPCVLARRRLFGWNVRLLTCTSPRWYVHGKGCTRTPPGTRSEPARAAVRARRNCLLSSLDTVRRRADQGQTNSAVHGLWKTSVDTPPGGTRDGTARQRQAPSAVHSHRRMRTARTGRGSSENCAQDCPTGVTRPIRSVSALTGEVSAGTAGSPRRRRSTGRAPPRNSFWARIDHTDSNLARTFSRWSRAMPRRVQNRLWSCGAPARVRATRRKLRGRGEGCGARPRDRSRGCGPLR
jgi:hypothetical protein